MQYKQFGNTYMIRIDPGEDIVGSLKKLCEDEQIRLGRVEAIGAADHAVIGVYDLLKKEYYPEQLDEFMEIASLNGNITTMGGNLRNVCYRSGRRSKAPERRRTRNQSLGILKMSGRYTAGSAAGNGCFPG